MHSTCLEYRYLFERSVSLWPVNVVRRSSKSYGNSNTWHSSSRFVAWCQFPVVHVKEEWIVMEWLTAISVTVLTCHNNVHCSGGWLADATQLTLQNPTKTFYTCFLAMENVSTACQGNQKCPFCDASKLCQCSFKAHDKEDLSLLDSTVASARCSVCGTSLPCTRIRFISHSVHILMNAETYKHWYTNH